MDKLLWSLRQSRVKLVLVIVLAVDFCLFSFRKEHGDLAVVSV